MGTFSTRQQMITLVLIALGLLIIAMSLDPIPQSVEYHGFADARTIWGIPNFWNVISNLPFLWVGGAGLMLRGARSPAWMTAFAGCTLVSFGSIGYHLTPNHDTLVWDRIPIAVAFMGVFVAIVQERIDARATRLLAPLVVLGIASVIWWAHTDDLRFYVWVQGSVILMLPVILLLTRGQFNGSGYVVACIGFYVLAKAFEFADLHVFHLTAAAISGHSLKHVMAAAAIGCLYLMISSRAPQD